MMIKHSTAVPIKLSASLIQRVHAQHLKIVASAKEGSRENTNDARCAFTRSASIPAWAK